MDGIDEIFQKQVIALRRAIFATKSVKDDNFPCQIEERLFLGSLGAAHNKSALKDLNITHILTVGNFMEPADPNDFACKTIDVPDREDFDIRKYFGECFDFIDDAKKTGGSVLVHCFMGRSRSVTIIVAYLMKPPHSMSLSKALEYVQSKRPVAAPNSGFMLQLQDYEKILRGTLAFM
ncbi:hypothetical protein RJ639_004080 [Escallonia herrerae]|uniref:Dual specificity protein phosphatase 1 n=1 Tax=Escallonia herrerae TaxID=1293975 RepID=A0AA88WAT1_9ASTE|nr:hypothetical protein RJ639_004080 [Escallonia herrerae]